MFTSTLALQFVSFLAAAAPVVLWSLRGEQDHRVSDRLRRLRRDRLNDLPLEAAGNLTQRWILRLASPWLTSDLHKRGRLQQRLAAAGLAGPLASHVFIACRFVLVLAALVAGISLPAVCALPWDLLLPISAALLGVAFLFPGLWLERMKARRHVVLLRSLPDFLDLLVTCAESGLSLEGSLKRVTTELRLVHPVLAGEMDRVQNEIELGSTPEAALQHFAARSDMEAIRTLASFVQHARRFGGSIVDALRTHSDMLRDRREQRAEELAQKAAVKILFPTLLLIFPAVFVVVAGPAVIQLTTEFGSKH